jgi:AraC family transcriptional regulator
MDWQARMSKALNYLEEHLTMKVDLEQAAREANCSPFHFFRMFEVITGISPGEYVRRRRLSAAALALSAGHTKVIAVAMQFGYESPDAFARAFKREFGVLPKEARKAGTHLHSFPPLSFSIMLKGDKPMEYRIEQGRELKLAGISVRVKTKDGINFTVVPDFWDKVMASESWKQLCAQSKPVKTGGLGIIGVCRDFDMASGDFTYSIAVEEPVTMKNMPKGTEFFTIPAVTWGKFTSHGPLRPNFQAMIKRIFSEWLPASDWEHAGTAEIEYYAEGDADSADYMCEYWVPLVKAKKK